MSRGLRNVKRSFRSNASSNVNAPTTIRGRLPHTTWTDEWPVKLNSCFALLMFQDSSQCLVVLGEYSHSVSNNRTTAIANEGSGGLSIVDKRQEQIQKRFESSQGSSRCQERLKMSAFSPWQRSTKSQKNPERSKSFVAS